MSTDPNVGSDYSAFKESWLIIANIESNCESHK